MSRNARGMVLAVVALALAWVAGPARADVSGLGPGDSLGDPAGPMQMGVEYSGAFKSDHDLDHVLFSVANPGATLQFVVTNTYGGCDRQQLLPDLGHAAGHRRGQLGGEGSGAGTGPVGAQTSDSIVWTFPEAGNYILVLEGNGDLATYRFRADVTNAGRWRRRRRGRRRAPPPPQITRLHSAGRQRGTAVRALLTLRPAASRVTASLVADGRRFGRTAPCGWATCGAGPRPGRGIAPIPLFAHVRRALASLKSLRVTLVVTVKRGGSRPIVLRLPVLLKPPLR